MTEQTLRSEIEKEINEYQKKFLRDGIAVMCYNALTLTKKYEGGGFISGNGFAQLWYPENQTQGNTVCCGDIDGDGKQEIILPYDDTQIAAFKADGTKVNATAFGAGVTWDKVDNDIKVTSDNMSSSNFENTFSKSAKYFAPFIVNLDRTRYVNKDKGYDWSNIPADTGTILTLGEEVLSNPGTSVSIIDPDCRPVVADGVKEILYTANDGQVHCFSLDGTEHGARTPSNERGKLYVLDYTGKHRQCIRQRQQHHAGRGGRRRQEDDRGDDVQLRSGGLRGKLTRADSRAGQIKNWVYAAA